MDNFETSALNDLKMTLVTNRSKVPHVHKTPESLVLLRFALQPAILELHAILSQVHRMNPK